MDYVVSSYTPTATALMERTRVQHARQSNSGGLLLTCQPDALCASRIPGTVKEVETIHMQAVKHGVKRFAYVAASLADEENNLGGLGAVPRYLKENGIERVVVRPTWFIGRCLDCARGTH